MTENEEEDDLTDLDEALSAARADAAKANYFYDTFLNSLLSVPVFLDGRQSGEWRKIGAKDPFNPLFVSHGETRLVPVFDRLEKLKQWAGERVLDYLPVKGHLFIQVLAANVSLVLNPGTPWNYTFTPKMLETLRAAMRPASLN